MGGPLTLTSLGSGIWSASGNLLFTGHGLPNWHYLPSGTLSQVSLIQDGSGGAVKTILRAHLTGLTGTLAGKLTGEVTENITITGAGGTPLPDLLRLAAGLSANDTIYSGVVADPVAEPNSVVLLGCGLGAVVAAFYGVANDPRQDKTKPGAKPNSEEVGPPSSAKWPHSATVGNRCERLLLTSGDGRPAVRRSARYSRLIRQISDPSATGLLCAFQRQAAPNIWPAIASLADAVADDFSRGRRRRPPTPFQHRSRLEGPQPDRTVSHLARPLSDYNKKGRFVRISIAGRRKSHVHDVVTTKEVPSYRLD